MWASDFLDLGAKGKVLVTVDERSLFKIGWSLCEHETAAAVIAHARRLLRRRKRRPLVWKFDHGSAFTGGEFRGFLTANGITPYPIARRAPWTNGRCERGHREVRDWLLRAGKDLARELARGIRMLNFAKPRPVLGFRRAAQVYFRGGAIGDSERRRFLMELQRVRRTRRGPGERAQRLAVKASLARLGLYEELRPARGTK